MNGNLLHTSTASTAPRYDYDAWNRLAGYDTDATVNASRYEYPYDALHRRAIDYKYVDYGNQLPQDPEIARIDLYYSDRWQVIEDQSEHSELSSSTTTTTTNAYVWSPGYVDDLVLRDRKVTTTDGENSTEEDVRLYAQHDHNFNVTSLVSADSSPAVEQRFVFDPYGAATAFTNNYQLTTNNFAWVYLHQGGRQNEINGLYSFRYRELNASLGRWMQQDPARYVDGSSLYQAVVSNPVNLVDPIGLWASIILGRLAPVIPIVVRNGVDFVTEAAGGSPPGAPTSAGGFAGQLVNQFQDDIVRAVDDMYEDDEEFRTRMNEEGRVSDEFRERAKKPWDGNGKPDPEQVLGVKFTGFYSFYYLHSGEIVVWDSFSQSWTRLSSN